MTTSTADVEALRALNKRFIHNFVTNDVPSHDSILHTEFRTITPSGGHFDRSTYLRQWATGFDPNVIIYWDMRDERITCVGEVALISATNKHTRVRDGAQVTGMTCYTDTYVREGRRWLCVLAQLTAVAPENYPSDDTIVVRYLNGQMQP